MMSVPKAMIVYASLTGNTEEIAFKLGDKLKALNVDVEVEECMQLYPEELQDMDICVVATYTYGTDGDLPDEILDFYEDMEGMDLSGKVYGVLGSGQTFYEHFCRAVDYFEARFQETMAIKGSKSLKFELNVSKEQEHQLEKFAEDLLKTYHAHQK